MLERLVKLKRPVKIALMLLMDAICLPMCFFLATALRLGTWRVFTSSTVLLAAVITGVAIVFFVRSGLYGAVIRFIEMQVVQTICLGLGIVVLAGYLVMLLFGQNGTPRTSLAIFWLIAFVYVSLSRFGARSFIQRLTGSQHRNRQKVLIYGAGGAGAQLAQAMRQSREYEVVFFIDDDPALRHKTVAGIRVYGPHELHGLLDRYTVSMIVLAMPSLSPSRRSEVIESLAKFNITTRALPGIVDLVDGKITISSIRELELSDLLGRDPVPPRPDLFSRCIKGKSVLVTGAGGSIGSELCRQIASQQPAHLVLLDHSEFNLYAIEAELQSRAPALPLTPILGSVCDETLLERVLADYATDTVYHAAAYKHVPLVESNMHQGVLNNVMGSLAVARAAGRAKVATCVLISTDKAVRPTNVMGCTKRIAELVFQAAATKFSDTCFSMVRFGNVLGSSGSVVPLFKKQIVEGGPITLTHADINRYFMLIPEAAQLVIQAGAMAQGGDVFVLDMGSPVRIIDLARKMIHLSGFSEKTPEFPNGDIAISIVGLRPGEKLYEELLIGDDVMASEHRKIMRAHERMVPWEALMPEFDTLFRACRRFDREGTMLAIMSLVPEYAPQPGEDIGAVPSPATSSC
ncbi:capsular biosynthesis protein [Pandoraea terrae]|uniref:Capsular biosynthesis protein n=1 Tax=Pandoraea terrae TaxID=1537710 RepID=A0A5E4Y7Y1_9BURK|nr:nucleoside-diphosphate sugar epimerase/dehydratase [Pandoraea terrae]VVE44547.1 capsular biosynthesis protein [Pandoraea terrae]